MGKRKMSMAMAVPLPAHMVEDTFHRDYEFVKPHTVRSPLSKWEHRHKVQDKDSPWMTTSKRELRMLEGVPHPFKHTGKAGRLRVSGSPNAHQIGKRSRKK